MWYFLLWSLPNPVLQIIQMDAFHCLMFIFGSSLSKPLLFIWFMFVFLANCTYYVDVPLHVYLCTTICMLILPCIFLCIFILYIVYINACACTQYDMSYIYKYNIRLLSRAWPISSEVGYLSGCISWTTPPRCFFWTLLSLQVSLVWFVKTIL